MEIDVGADEGEKLRHLNLEVVPSYNRKKNLESSPLLNSLL